MSPTWYYFITYLVAVIFEISLGRSISQTFLVILASYLLIHFAEAFILKKYGKSKTIEDFARTTETHTSRTLELFCILHHPYHNRCSFDQYLGV